MDMDDQPPQAPTVPAAADQVQSALAALRQQLTAETEAADPEGVGARCAEVLAAARRLERAAAADLRAAGRSWAAVGRALGMTKQSAHERFGSPAVAPDRHRQELLTTPTHDPAPTATGQQPAEVDTPGRGRPPGRRHAAGRQDPLTGSQQPGQAPPTPARQRRGRRGAAPSPTATKRQTTTSAPSYDLAKAPDHATTGGGW